MSHAPATEVKATVTLTIDGKSVEVKRGATLLEAANQTGAKIPTLCYLHKTHPIGSCRVCSVEVEGVDSPVMSCCTPAADGMVVVTENERIKEFRRNMVQFILVNHPLDCPVCERSGECKLQNLTYQLGIKKHDWGTTTVKRVPVVDWGLIRYNQNLCIMCERCIRVCREVQGIAAYKVDGTGYGAKINTVTGEPLDCDFCGQCISVCPVGALSSGMYFSARSWEMQKTASVCAHCGVGCSFHYNTKKGKIVRVTSNDGIGNNKGNLCARGRFGYEFIQSPDRLTAPMIRRGHGFETTDWDTALGYVAEKLAGYKKEGPATFSGIGSERGMNEDAFAFQKFFREVLGSGYVNNLSNLFSPSSAGGLFDTFGDFPMTMNFDDLKKGNLFIFIGLDGSNENPVVSNHIREAIFGHGAEVALAYSREAFFLPTPKMKLVYEYPALHHFVLALLGETVRIGGNGGFEGGLAAQPAFAQKLEAALPGSLGHLEDGLKKQVSQLAALIKKKQKPVFLIGQEVQRHPQGEAIMQNIVNTAKVAGGAVMMMREYCNTRGANDMGLALNVLPGYKKEERTELKGLQPLLAQLNSLNTKALIIADEDPLRRCSDFAAFRGAMDKVEFTVVIDHFYTATAMASDVILPSCTAAEKDGTFTNIEGRIQQVNRAVDPVGNSLPVWRIMAMLAKKMGADFGYSEASDVAGEIARAVPAYGNIANGGVADFSGLITASPALKWTDPAPLKNPKDGGGMMILAEPSLFVMGNYTDYCPSLRKLVGKHFADFHVEGKPYIDMNPDDASRFGLKENDTVLMKAPKREWHGRVRMNPATKAGSLRIPDEMDHSPVVTLVANGHEIACFNHLGLR